MKYETLQIYRPCISDRITQGWGENRACLRQNGTVYGVPKGSTCPSLSFYESLGMRGHSGVDIGGLKGQDIYHAATFKGWWKAGHDSAGGLGVDVVSNEPLFFKGPIPEILRKTAFAVTQDGVEGFAHYVKMRYWHLSLQVGHERKQVSVGTTIGLMGNTGMSSATHLHFAPKWCDKDGNGVAKNNGFFGAFDPTPYYLHRTTAKDHADMLRLEVVPLTTAERQDMLDRLGLLQQLLVALQKLKHYV